MNDIEEASLRPRGRSGLKYIFQVQFGQFIQSPSSRAEWVEIQATDITVEELRVSVLAGGVG